MSKFKPKFKFGSKAQTLERLEPLLPPGTVPQVHYFQASEWLDDPGKVLAEIRLVFPDCRVIVRSSSIMEDGEAFANAGAFLSVPDIDPRESGALADAITDVVESYSGGTERASNMADHVLIQKMISNPQMSGVIFTQDLSTGAPYYVINYDDETGSTDTVTGGSYNNRTLYILRSASDLLSSERFGSLLDMVLEIERQVESDCIDIEFAVEDDGTVRIFQVRRITTQPNWNRGIALQVSDGIGRAHEFIEMRYGLQGKDSDTSLETVLGNMPDWNPAEMIGTAPRPLALSLYRHLITDKTWRVGRSEMGYQHRVGRPLMVSLLGQPFIDTKESFYSFLPCGLDEDIQDRIVNAWLEHLRANHHLHDKVEFEVATTAFALDFDLRAEPMLDGVLSEEEYATYRSLLLDLTSRHVKGELGGVESQLERLEVLRSRRTQAMTDAREPSLELVSQLIEDAIELGTLPFSILARHGFVAVSWLRSLVNRGVLSQDQSDEFQSAVPTVASEFLDDLAMFRTRQDDDSLFNEKYGHLRPGTYDILSLRYDSREAIRDFSRPDRGKPRSVKHFSFSEDTLARIDEALAREQVGFDAETLIDYVRKAIIGREYAKFEFTHNLSDALEVMAAWGERFGLSRDELSFIDYRALLDEMIGTPGRSIESSLREVSEQGRLHYRLSTAARLPFLITRLSDLYIVPLGVDQPNFVTRKNVSADRIEVTSDTLDPTLVNGKIVLIESADPGYDWIFSRSIEGLITRYGGANSHMAIRCAEFELPAAIGCGEQMFERARKAGSIELNCAEGVIKFL
jgi:glutamine kinase